MRPGLPAKATHDYKRHGTTTLFAALEVATGKVTDVTYIWTDEGFVYLAAIIDCCTRMVVGWSTADHLRTALCTEALQDAVAKQRPGPGLMHHSDRGCQYTSHDYRKALSDLGFVRIVPAIPLAAHHSRSQKTSFTRH